MACMIIDEHRICIALVTIGEGAPLFKSSHATNEFPLFESRPLNTGGVLLRYGV